MKVSQNRHYNDHYNVYFKNEESEISKDSSMETVSRNNLCNDI